MDLVKIENFFFVKATVKTKKRQATEQKKIFLNHISDERLVSRKHKNSQNSMARKQTT